MTKIVCFADIHNRKIELPKGDILIFAGDLVETGYLHEFERMAKYMNSLDYPYKIMVWGNHDRLAELYPAAVTRLFKGWNILTNEPYYNREHDLSFYGTPINKRHDNWAFQPKPEIRKQHFKMIPNETDILITHTPPLGILDQWEGQTIGDDLLAEILPNKKFKYNVFGHAHEGYGQMKIDNKNFVNCAIMTKDYKATNKPIIITI